MPDTKFIISIKVSLRHLHLTISRVHEPLQYNSQDFVEGGFSADESRLMAQRLEEAGLDIIELSGGTYESLAFEHKKESTKKREGFFVEFADQIRPHLKKSVLAVTGGFRTADAMANAIKGKSCDSE